MARARRGETARLPGPAPLENACDLFEIGSDDVMGMIEDELEVEHVFRFALTRARIVDAYVAASSRVTGSTQSCGSDGALAAAVAMRSVERNTSSARGWAK